MTGRAVWLFAASALPGVLMVGCNAILGIQEFASPDVEGGADAARDEGNVESEGGAEAAQSEDATTMDSAADGNDANAEATGDASMLADADASAIGDADGNASGDADSSAIRDADANAIDDAAGNAGGDADSSAIRDADANAIDDAAGTADVADAKSDGSGALGEGGSAAPPSCSAGGDGLTNCGASAESCCTSLPVKNGTYNRTYANSGAGPSGEADPASVSSYDLDKYLVTVGRFRQFVRAVLPPDGGAGWLPPEGSGKHSHLNAGKGLANSGTAGAYEAGWAASDNGEVMPTDGNLAGCAPYSTWTSSVGGSEKLPINCVNWWESYAFCIWDNGFLPSESEWEYAAAGGSQELEYPWGSDAPGTSNQYAIYGDGSGKCYFPNGATCTGAANFAPVGTATLGFGRFGQLDLTGDVGEWTLDWYAATYAVPCADCAYLAPGASRIFRGGSYSGYDFYLLPPVREGDPPTNRLSYVGFRCARTL